LLIQVEALFVSYRNPYFEGELDVAYTSVSLSNGYLDIYYPSNPDTYAVGLFLTGLGGNVPSSLYTSFLTNVASHGVVMVSMEFFPPKLPLDSLYLELLDVINWMAANLTSQLPKGVFADVQNNLIGMAHSAGSKIFVKLLEEECSLIQGMALVDPVDGADPWGWINDYVITPGQLLNFSVPTLILGTGLGPISRHGILPPCAPLGRNFPRFYNAWYDNAWSMNASDYGHTDVLDPLFSTGTYYTQLCASNDNQMNYYWSFASGAVSAYTMGVIQRNCDALEYLQNYKLIPITNIGIQTKLSSTCPKPGCSRVSN